MAWVANSPRMAGRSGTGPLEAGFMAYRQPGTGHGRGDRCPCGSCERGGRSAVLVCSGVLVGAGEFGVSLFEVGLGWVSLRLVRLG